MYGQPSGHAARAAPRAKIFQPAEMLLGGVAHRIHLLDLSRVGALVHADATPDAGSLIQLRCAGPLGAARVAWVRGKRFGVAFLAPLNQSRFDTILGETEARAPMQMNARQA